MLSLLSHEIAEIVDGFFFICAALLEFQREFNSYYGPDPAKYPLGMYPY